MSCSYMQYCEGTQQEPGPNAALAFLRWHHLGIEQRSALMAMLHGGEVEELALSAIVLDDLENQCIHVGPAFWYDFTRALTILREN